MPAPGNLIHEQSASTGTGNLTTASVYGKRRFSDEWTPGATQNVFTYFISHRGAAEWEIGTGHESAAGTFVRDTVIQSSNANAAVDFSVGTKDITNYPVAGSMMLNDVEDQGVTGGARITVKDLGTQSAGTLTPDPGDRAIQKCTNGGAFELAPGSNYGNYILDVLNNASAGAITLTGWTKVLGDGFTTTNGHKFRCYCSVTSDGSLLQIQALQ